MQKKTLGRFRKVLQIIKDEIIDDVDNDANINDDDEHSGSPILKKLIRPKVFKAHDFYILPFLAVRNGSLCDLVTDSLIQSLTDFYF